MAQHSPQLDHLSLPQAGEDQALIERLEYGKYCQTHDGSILPGEEHGYLGKSSGFPYWLRKYCDPAQLGVRASVNEPLWRQAPHSTLLRPVLQTKDTPTPVFYRLRQRPESSNDSSGSREYTLARYLWSQNGSPLRFLRAMNSEPLAGLTAKESGELRSMNVPGVESTRPSSAMDVDELLVFIVSGIPVCFPSWMEEDDFFAVVELVWRRLPLAIQPLLSAGWNVGNSLSGTLMIACGPGEPTNAALWRSGKFVLPSTIRYWNEAAKKTEQFNFQDSFLIPGRIFVNSGNGGPQIRHISMHFLDEEPSQSYLFPDFQDRRTIFRFRRVGFGSKKAGLLQVWIESNASEMELLSIVPHLQDFEEASHLILREWKDRKFARRIEKAVLLLGTQYPKFDAIARESSPRYRLLKSIEAPGSSATWNVCVDCIRSGEFEPISEENRGAIYRVLDTSLQKSAAISDHISLVSAPSLPESYLQWLQDHAFDLALNICQHSDEPLASIEALGMLTHERALSILQSFLRNERPAPNAVSALTATGEGIAFGALLLRRWTSHPGSGLTVLVEWLRAFWDYVRLQADPLLNIVIGKSPHNVNPDAVCREIARWKAVLVEFPDELAAYILENWPKCQTSIRREPELWFPATRLWQPALQFLLLGQHVSSTPDEVVHCNHRGVWLWALDFWTSGRRVEDLSQASPMLFDWGLALDIHEEIADGLKALSKHRPPKPMAKESFHKMRLIAMESGRLDPEQLSQLTSTASAGRGSESVKEKKAIAQEKRGSLSQQVKIVLSKQPNPFIRMWRFFRVRWFLSLMVSLLSVTLILFIFWIQERGLAWFHKESPPKITIPPLPSPRKPRVGASPLSNTLDIVRNAASGQVQPTVVPLPGTKKLWPRWSPDGASFIYTAQVNTKRQLFVVRGEVVKQITNEPADCANPIWSRDGSKIFYISRKSLWSIGASGGPPSRIVANVLGAAIHSDGTTLALVRDGRLWTTQLALKNQKKIENALPASPDISFSPDGSRLGFFAETGRTGETNFCVLSYPEFTPIQCQDQALAEFGWFPDSNQVALALVKPTSTGAWRLDTFNIESTDEHMLFQYPQRIRFPSVNSEGQVLVSIGGEIVKLGPLQSRP